MTWTRHQCEEQQKTVPRHSQQKGMGTRLEESHTARGRRQTDRVRREPYSFVPPLVSLSSQSPVQQEEEEEEERVRLKKPKTKLGFLAWKCFKAKAHTHTRTHTGLTHNQEQQLWGFQTQQERECVTFPLHTELFCCCCFFINIHYSFIKHVSKTYKVLHDSRHLQYKDA